ncbi:MAG: conserved rane protein of unknown function [Ilumatobacteraceae bacterium]|nr:conserved rane protein of unknown function [Ilumatobacteraceae bacterium]
MLFRLGNVTLALVVIVIVGGVTALGVVAGRRLQAHHDDIKEPIGAVQAALLGFVGLLLAFGLTMAVGRYENRRASVVTEANAIGTAYLRAQTIAEPQRTQSIDILRTYAAERLHLARLVSNSRAFTDSVSASGDMQRRLWKLAGESLAAAPQDSAPRLYVDSLNTMFDDSASREAAFVDRIPDAVVYLQIGGAAVSLGVLGLYLATLGRRVLTAGLAALLVSMILLVALDLDRPQRGFITVPSRALQSLVTSMQLDPAASAPGP